MQKSKILKPWMRFLSPVAHRRRFFAVRRVAVDWEKLPKLMPIRGTADVLGVHPNTLRLWDNQGRLRAIRIGARHDRRYDREEVRRLYLERRQTPAEEYIVRWASRRELLNRLRQPWVRTTAVSSMMMFVVAAISSSQFAVADTTQRTDVVIPPQRCVGWQSPERAETIEVSEAGAINDFSKDNSASYSTEYDRVSSDVSSSVTTAGLDGIDPMITCSDFDLPELPSDATIEQPKLSVSFVGRAAGTTAGSFVVEATVDGSTWKTYGIIPAQTEQPGRLTFALGDNITLATVAKLQIRLRPDIDIDAPAINALLDGVALRLTTITSVPLNPQKNKQTKQSLDKLVDFSQDVYTSTEEPVVVVPKKEIRKFLGFTVKRVTWELDRVQVFDADANETDVKHRVTDQGTGDAVESAVRLETANLHPGKYVVHVTMHNDEGGTATIEREVLWGVVALNFERASPQPNEEERVGLGILDDLGRTICDADVTVKVRDPKGRTTTYQTSKQTITRNPNCIDKGVTNEPDYHFSLTPKLVGTYHVMLKAQTTIGERSYEDNLFVVDNQRFDVQRVEYPTRINPYAGYPVRIAVTPRRAYSGLVYERVPEDFKIYQLPPNTIVENDPAHPGMKRIVWEVEWKKDSTYYLTYKFVAPQISPALFLTGPLAIGGNDLQGADFTEPRQWQIASDSISSISWDGSASSLWSNPANWSTNAIPQAGDYLVFPAGAANYSNTNDLGQNMWFNSITFYDSGYTLAGDRIILGQGRATAGIILPGVSDTVTSGGNTISLDLQFDTTQLITVTNSGEALTISGAISGVGGLSKQGLGELIFSGANSYAGVTKVNVGSLNIRHARGLGTILAGTEVVGEAALEIEGSLAIDREALTLRGYGQSSSGALRNISGTSSYGGAITIAGTTEIASDSGTLTLNGGLSGTFNLNLDGAGDITFDKASLGAAAATTVTKNGSGTVRFNFPNTYTGLTTVNAGTLAYGCDNATMSGGITVNGGTLDIGTYSDMQGTITLGTLAGGSGTISGSTGMLSSATWTLYAGTISAKIGGDGGALSKSTPGTVTLSGANEFTGATTLSAGILKLQNSNALGTVDGVTTLTSGASLQIDGNGLSIPEFITITGVGLLNQGAIFNTTGDNEITGLVTLSAAASIESATGTTLTFSDKGFTGAFGVTFDATGDIVVSAPIQTSSGALIKDGPGNLTLTNYNSYTGTTTINFGTLTLNGNGSITTSSGITTNSGAKLVMDNSSTAIDRVGDAVAVTMNGGDIDFYGNSSTDTLGILGALTMSGGQNTITVFAGTGGYSILRFASLTRTPGASGLFRGASLGATPGPNVATIRFTIAPTLIGDDDAAGTPKVSIIQGIFGDNSPSGNGTDMVTYGRGNNYGVRLLNGAGFSNEYTSDYLVTNANVKLTTATAAVTTQINSLILDTGASITDPGSSQTITLTSGNILNLEASGSIAGANTILAGGSVEFSIRSPQALYLATNITTTGGLTKSGIGTATFATAKTYTGLTAINAGTLLYGIDNAINTGNVTVHDATLDMATYNDTVGAVVAQGGTITGTSGVLTATSYSFRASTISAIIGGSGTTTIANTGERVDAVTILSRDNTYTGSTSISSGILKLGGAGGGTYTPLGTTAGATSITNGAMLDLNGYSLGTTEAINTFRGTGIAGQGAIINSSASPATYQGALTIATSARIGADYGKITISGSISGTGLPLTVGGFGDIDITGAITTGASGTVTKDGFGTYTPSSSGSTYTGATTISAGRLKLGGTGSGSNTPLGTTAGATVITNAVGASFDMNGYTLVTAEPLTVNGIGAGTGDFASGAVLNSGSAVTYSGPVTLGASSMICGSSGSINFSNATMAGTGFTITLCGSGGGTIGSAFTGGTNGAIIKIDTGTWTLSGNSTYTGATTIFQGTIQLGGVGSGANTPLGTTGTGTTIYSGGSLDLNGNTLVTAEALTINGFGVADGGVIVNNSGSATGFSGTRALGSDTRITNAGAGLLTLSGAQSGAFESRFGGAGNITMSAATAATASSLYKDGAGTMSLTAANGHTGNTYVFAGTLQDGILNGLAATNVVVAGGTFDLSSNNADTVAGVYLIDGTISTTGGASAILTGTSYTIESGTISGVIAGAVAITKNTSGTAAITAAITTSSTLTVNRGTLTFSGSGAATSVTAATISVGASFVLDNSTTAVASRLSDTLVVTMNDGNFDFKGNSGAAASETIGQLAYASGHNVVTVTPGAGGATTLTVANATCLNRTAGATVLYRGTSFGSTAGAGVSTLLCTTPPTTTYMPGAAGAANSTTISVLKGSFGDGSLTGTGTDMVTYNVGNTNGLRLLDGAGFSGEYAADFATTNANVKITTNTAAATRSINSLIINGGDVTNPGSAQTVTISNGTALAGNILIASANNIAGANTTIGITTNELDILATASSTISAVLGTAASGSVAVSGDGTVSLNAANAYTGTTYVTDATLQYLTTNALSSGGVTLVDGTLDLNGNSDTIGALSLNYGNVMTGAGTLTLGGTVTSIASTKGTSRISGNLGLGANRIFDVADGAVDHDLLVSAVVSGAFTVTKSTGTGVLVLSGDSTYSGTTTISNGTIRLGAAGGSTNTPVGTSAGNTTVSSGAAFDFNGFSLTSTEVLATNGTGISNTGVLLNTSSAAVTYPGLLNLIGASAIYANYGDINITNTGTVGNATVNLELRGNGNGSFASILGTTTGTLTKSGTGTWTVSGASTYTGVTTISVGVLKLGSGGSGSNTPLGTTSTGTTIASGAMLDLNGYTLTTAENLTNVAGTGIANAGFLTTNSASATSYSGTIALTAAARITNFGTGTFTLSGANSGNFALTIVTAPGTIDLSGVRSGSSTITKEGSGVLILSGQNSFSGAITVSTGILRVGATGGGTNTPLGTIAGGVTVSLGAVLDLSTFTVGGASTWEPLGLSGTGLKNGGAVISSASGNNNFGVVTVTANSRIVNSGSGTITLVGNVSIANTINLGIGGTGPTTISGGFPITTATSATLAKWDSGLLLMSNAGNVYTGLTRIYGGTLRYGAANAVNTGGVTLAGGTLDFNGQTDSVGAIILYSGTITDSNVTPGALTGTSYTFYGGAISGVLGGTAIAMAKNSGSALTINKSFTNTGTLTANAGTVQYLASNVLSNSSALTVAGGTIDMGANSDTVAAVTLTSGSILSSTGVLTGASYSVATGKISAILAGAVNLTKTSTGTVVLAGTNTYTGITTIQGGALSVETIGNGTVPGNLGAATNAAANIVFSTATGTLIYTGGTASTDRNITTTTAITMQIDVNDPAATLTMSGATTNTTAPFTKVGGGTLALSGTNLHTGVTTVLSGTLKYLATNVLSTGAVTVTNGILDMNGQTDSVGAVTLTNGGQIIDSAGSAGVLTSTATFALQSGFVSAKLGSAVAAGISKTTTDRVVLSGDNTFTSTSIALSAGKLRIGHNNALGASGTTLATTVTSGAVLETYNGITVPSTKTLTLNGTGIVAQGALLNVSDSNTIAGAVTLGATGVRINSAGGSLTCSGTMTGTGFAVTFGGAGDVVYSGAINTSTAGTLTKDGAGKLTLTSANNYTGATAINAGTVDIQNATSLGTTAGGVTVADGATLQASVFVTVGVEALTLNGNGVGGVGALYTIVDGLTWQGAVTLASNTSIGAANSTFTTVSGAITGAGSIGLTKVGLGNVTIGTTTLGGDLAISAGTLIASGASAISVGGNWSNSGTFTANSSTVTLNGTAQQAVSGTTSGATGKFNALTITNAFGDGSTTWSVTFAGNTETAATFTAITANTKLRFNAGSTYTFQNISFNGQASGTKVFLRSSSNGSAWNLAVAGTRSVSNTNVQDSDATTSGTAIDATDGTNTDNTGNTNWSFVLGITVSGGCFTDATEGTACTDDGSDQIKVAWNGTLNSGVDAVVDGAWSFTLSGSPANGDILVFFRDGEATAAEEATTVVKYDGSGNVTNVKMYQSQLVIGTDSGSANSDQTMTVANLDTTTNGYENSDDEDVIYDVTAGADLTVDAEADKTERLYVMNGETFQPASGGGSDTTTHHLEIDATAIMTADSNAINVAGDFLNAGTFTSGTSTLTMNGTGTLTSNGNTINNFATSGGGTVTLANATHTFAGDVTLGSTGLTAGTSTVVMTGTKNLVGGGKTLNNLTIDGTNTTVSVITSGLTVSGTLTIGGDAAANTDVLSIASLITVSAPGTTTMTDSTDTISGAGTLRFVSTSSGPGTTGTLSSQVLFVATVGNNVPSTTVDARTYGSTVDFAGAGTITLPAGTFTIGGGVTIWPDGVPSSSLTLDASNGGASNPTISITGNLTIGESGPSNDATFISGTGTLTVGGNVDFQYGAYTATSGNTLVMNGTTKTLYAGGNSLYNLTISGGSITNTLTLTVANNYNQTAGTFTHAANTTMTVTGTSFTIANGATWTKTSGTGKLVLDHVTNLAFADNNATKQNLGVVQVGASPGTVTLTTDMSADTVTVPTGDTFNTKGYDVTATGAFACNGTCALDLTDSGGSNEGDGTILDVGGDFTMSSTGTLTAATGKVYLNSTSGTDTNRTFTTGGKAYNDVELKNAGATNDDITISGTPFDINGTLTLTDGQVRLDTNDPNVTLNGNLSINANATVTKADNGTATWTFDGATSPSTWTDGTGSGGQDLGLVHINGSTKTVNLASSAKATKLIIAASQTFGLGSSAYVFTLTGSGVIPDQPLQNSGTLTEGSSSTVKFTGTSASDVDPEGFNNLNISPSGAGSPTYTFDVNDTGNPFDITGTFVIGDGANAVSVQSANFAQVTVTGDITISASATLIGGSDSNIRLGSNYTNNGTFTDAGNGFEFTATTTGKTLAGNLTGANAMMVTFSGSGGEWTNTSAIDFIGLYMAAGTFTGSNNVTVNGAANGTGGVINRTGGTFTQNPSSASFFGPSTASTTWTFNNLTYSTPSGSQVVVSTSNCATCTYTINGAVSVGTKITLAMNSGIWNVTGSFTTTTTGSITSIGAPSVTVQGAAIGGGSGNILFYNLTKSGAGSTSWTGSGENAVKVTLTISAGTLVAPSGRLVVGTIDQSGGTFTHNSGTVLVNSASNQTLKLTSNANSVVLNDGLVGYWNFDETSGTNAADSSGYGYDGTHNGTPTIDSDVPSVNFTNARSLSFNGTSQFVDMGTPEWMMNEWTDKISLSAWIKPTALSGDHVIVGQSESNTHAPNFYSWNIFQSGSQVCFRVGSTNICSASSTITTGWQNIIAVYDGANMYLYRNGTQVATTSKTGNLIPGTQNIRVGARHTSSMAEYYSGKIDDVRVYRRNLGSGEVTALSGGNLGTISAATYTLGAALTVAGNLSLIGGTLDVATGLDYAINVAGNWTNIGGAFTPRSGTVTLNGTASGKTLTSRQQAFNLLAISGASGVWTVVDDTSVSSNLTLTNGTLVGPTGFLTVGGDFNNAATYTHNSGTVIMNGTSKNITGATATPFNNLQISGTTGIDAAGSDITVASLLTVDNTKTLTINTGRTVTLSGTSGTTLSLVGTITGAGRLTYKNNATAFPATGTISSILRMDATAGDQTIGGTNSAARTFGGLVEIYSNSAGTAKTVTFENGTARTFAFSGNLYVIADNTQNLTLTADTATDPTVTVTGDVDYTGTGGGTENITSGTGTWTVSGNVDFTAGTFTPSTGTLAMNGASKTLTTNGQALYTLNFTGATGTTTLADNVTADGHVTLNSTISAGSTTFTITGTGRNFAPNSATLNNFTTSGTATMFQDMTLNGNMLITAGTFQISSTQVLTVKGNWTNSGGTFTPNTGTVTLAGTTSTTLNTGCANTDTCTNGMFNNLTINKTAGVGANDNVTLSSNGIRVANLFTITAGEFIQGTLNVRSEGTSAVSVGASGIWTNISTGDLKLGGTFVNAGSVTLNSNNGTQCVDGADDIAISSTSGGSQRTWSGAGTYVLYNLNVTDMADSAISAYTSTYSNTTWSVGSCGITISGTVYTSANESTAYDCTSGTGGQLDLVVAVNGDVTPDTGTCTSGVGTFSFTATDPGAANVPIALYVSSSESEKATLVTLSNAAAASITGLSLFLDRVAVSQQSGTAITNSHLNTADNGNAGIRYAVSAGNLIVESGMELHVLSGKTFTPGGAVTTTATGTAAGPAGDLHIAGTLTMGTNALTVGGDYNNVGTFNKTNTQTTTLAATGTGFTITPGTGDMNNLTVSGDAGGNGTYTLSGANLTVDGILNVNTGDTLTIDTSRTLTNSGSTEASLGGTINGAGTLRFINGSGGPGTGGTISVITRFDASAGDIASTTVDARTYSAKVELYASSSSDRTITLPSGTFTLSGSSSHLHMKADGAGDLTVDGSVNSPTVTVGGDIALNGTGGGIEAWVAGDNTWTSSGNVDTAQGFYAPRMAVLNPTWDNYGYEQDDYADDGFGGCDFLGTSSNAGTSSSTTLSQGITTGASSSCSPSASDFRNRTYMKFNLSGVSNTNTITRADLQVHASAVGTAFAVYRSNNDAPDGVAAGSLYAVGAGTGLSGSYTHATGVNMIPMSLGGTANIQSSLGNAAYAVVFDGGDVSVLTSVDSATNKPKLRIGYFATATTPTLVMNGTGTLSGGTQSGFYNLTMSGTNTFNAAHQATIYNTLSLTGSITTNSAPVVMAGSASTVIGGGNTLGNLTVSGGTTTLTTSDLTTSLNVQLLSSGTLSIASGRTFTAQGNVLLNSGTTISGSGTLTMTSTSSGPGTDGTLSSLVRYDATGGNIATTTFDARTYGGAVELYANSGSARTVTAPTGTFVFSGALSSTEAGAGSVSVDLNTNDPTVTITGATTIGANTTLSASNSGALNINGNYTNNGTFTDNGGTVTLAGAAQQTLAGTMTGSSDFNNLTVTNVSGSDPDSSPSVIFSTGFTTAGTFTAATANTKLRFAAGATYSPAAINLNGQATGTRVFLRSSTPGTSFTFSAGAGARTVSNSVIKDSNACGSTGGSIDADDGTNRDDGNTSCWLINKLIASLSANALDLQGLSSTVINQAGITNTVTTNAANGYVSLVKYNQTLTSGSNTISDTNGSIAAGENEFGVSSSQAGNTISQWSPTSCSNTGTTSTATALSTTFKSFASSASAVSGQVTTLCTLASTTALQQPGTYQSTITIVTTGKF